MNVTHESIFSLIFTGKIDIIRLKNILQTFYLNVQVPHCREMNSTAPVKISSENIHLFKSYDARGV